MIPFHEEVSSLLLHHHLCLYPYDPASQLYFVHLLRSYLACLYSVQCDHVLDHYLCCFLACLGCLLHSQPEAIKIYEQVIRAVVCKVHSAYHYL